jgi:hypothetical protein
VSRGGPGCGCWVCQTVVFPRLRGLAARAAEEEIAGVEACVACDAESEGKAAEVSVGGAR